MAALADVPTVEVSIEIDAGPAAIWELVTDIDLPARWSEEFHGASWVPPATGPEVGARFEGRNSRPDTGEWLSPCRVAWCEPERTFGWQTGHEGEPGASWRFTLDSAGDSTRLTYWAQIGPGDSGLAHVIATMPDMEEAIVDGRLESWRADMCATVEGIKELAEAEG